MVVAYGRDRRRVEKGMSAMNDNWATGWRSNLLGIGFRVLGIGLFVGGIVGAVFHPSPAWGAMIIPGFAMVMV